MNIITGYKAEPHITAQQDRNVNMGIFGTGTYIVDIGSTMAATVVSANEITIADGLLVTEGCTAEIERGTSESLEIANGSQGMLRTDLIVARYTKESGTGVEDMELAVITGTPAASSPADPSYNTGSIANGDTLVDFPLYRVSLNGISIESVTRIPSIVTIAKGSEVSALSALLATLSSTVTAISSRLGTATLNTTAQNALSAINELLTKINTLTSNLSSTNSTLSTVSGRVGTATLNTTAKNAMAAINELLTRITTVASNLATTNSNLSSVTSRTTALENKTAGIVKSISYDVAASSNNYKQLNASSMYLLILNGGTTSNTVRGIYQIGVTGGKAIGIKAISSATIAEVTDGGSGLLKIHNTGSVVLRATLITTYGS